MDRQSPWVVQWASGLPTLGPALATLARIGDVRALPMLAWVLDHEPLARDVGPAIASLGPAAARVVPLLRHRLAELPPEDERMGGLVRAAGAIGPDGVAALPEVLRVKPTQWTVTHIGGWGPAAADAIPALSTWTADPDRSLANAAALARWRIDGDADAAIAVLLPNLAGEPLVVRTAAEALFDIGVPVGPNQLRAAMAAPNHPYWVAMAAARTLWRFTGDSEALLRLLDDAWRHDLARPQVAAVWADLGPLATAAEPKLAGELAEPRRLHARRDIHSNRDVEVDEEFLAVVRRALAAIAAD